MENLSLKKLFTNIANAIREKEGSSEKIAAEDFADRIQNLSGSVNYNREIIGISSDKYKNGAIIFTTTKKYVAIVILPALEKLAPCAALLQKDGTYLAGYTVSSGTHEPEPGMLTITNSDGSYRYVWPVDPDGIGLDYVGSKMACIYVE